MRWVITRFFFWLLSFEHKKRAAKTLFLKVIMAILSVEYQKWKLVYKRNLVILLIF